jgi:hypothetical protein
MPIKSPVISARGQLAQAACLLVSCLSIFACSEDASISERSQWSGNIDTLPNGTIRIQNLSASSPEHEWRHAIEELRIGAPHGDGPDVFGTIDAIGVSPNGDIYVLDGQTQSVVVFDSGGTFLRTIGRRGQGPGEFVGAFGIGWDTNERTWIVDARNAKYSVFDASGELITEYRRAVPGVVYPWLGGFATDGFLYDVAPTAHADGTRSFGVFRVDSIGASIDSLPGLVLPDFGAVPTGWFSFTPRLTFRLDPMGYMWFATTDSYRILQRTLSGDTLRIVERAYTPLRVSPSERDSLERALVNERPPGMPAPAFPTVKPVIERLHVDEHGQLLVQLVDADGEPGTVIDVFDKAGVYQGQVRLPVRATSIRALPVFARGRIYAVTTDSMGIDYVVRLKLESLIADSS